MTTLDMRLCVQERGCNDRAADVFDLPPLTRLDHHTARVRGSGERSVTAPRYALDVADLSAPAAGRAAKPAYDEAAPHHPIADLRTAIACGAIQPGDYLPTVMYLAKCYSLSAGTAHPAHFDQPSDGKSRRPPRSPNRRPRWS